MKKYSIQEIRELNNKIETAPYIAYYHNPKSTHLLIYFGSYEGKFAGMTTVSKLGCSCIFIRSDKATWYLQDYGQYGKTAFDVFAYIDLMVKSMRNIKTVYIAGFSMGGFAALMAAPFIKHDKLIASAPQTLFPDYPVVKSIPVFPDSYSEEWRSVSSIWDKYGVPRNVIIQSCNQLGENESFRDCIECLELSKKYPEIITLYYYNCKGHKGITDKLLEYPDRYEKLFLPE